MAAYSRSHTECYQSTHPATKSHAVKGGGGRDFPHSHFQKFSFESKGSPQRGANKCNSKHVITFITWHFLMFKLPANTWFRVNISFPQAKSLLRGCGAQQAPQSHGKTRPHNPYPLLNKLYKVVFGHLLPEQELRGRTHSKRSSCFVTLGGFYRVDLPIHDSADCKEDLKYSFAERDNFVPLN